MTKTMLGCGKMFYIRDNNHQVIIWQRHNSRFHCQDLKWHYYKDCILLELAGLVAIFLNAIHDVSKYIFLKTLEDSETLEYKNIKSFTRHVFCFKTWRFSKASRPRGFSLKEYPKLHDLDFIKASRLGDLPRLLASILYK